MFDAKLFLSSIWAKLIGNKISGREAARQVGISASTMSRLLNGETPDINTFALVVKWLQMDANVFLVSPQRGEMGDVEQWARLVLCLEDLGMDKEFIDALVVVVKLINGKGKR